MSKPSIMELRDDLLEIIKSGRKVIANLKKLDGWENDTEILMTIKEIEKNLREILEVTKEI